MATYHSEQAALSRRRCPACEKLECRGQCTIPEIKAELESLYNGGPVPPWLTREEAIAGLEAELERLRLLIQRRS
jgi:hypothetical protein